MSQGFWKVYKAKVLQTFNAEQDGETQEENDTTEIIEPESPDIGEEGLNMSQLAKKVQGAFGWRSVTSLFSKDEDQRMDQRAEYTTEQESEQPPCPPPQENPPERNPSALWGVFSSRWHQNSAERSQGRGVLAEPPVESSSTQQFEETPFRWGFLTSKLAELRSKGD
ncbi:uncharacterized protein C1orf232 homolog [Spea bombifrons]|uniref:uncharacterized protein C1orf232 homolog n=1 Tax=Spea bombifrons TaxID=233779 RepID=UPI002349CFB5|nr:uncharacterized protein C1orf232 homolog [Spea bombifrons]